MNGGENGMREPLQVLSGVGRVECGPSNSTQCLSSLSTITMIIQIIITLIFLPSLCIPALSKPTPNATFGEIERRKL